MAFNTVFTLAFNWFHFNDFGKLIFRRVILKFIMTNARSNRFNESGGIIEFMLVFVYFKYFGG